MTKLEWIAKRGLTAAMILALAACGCGKKKKKKKKNDGDSNTKPNAPLIEVQANNGMPVLYHGIDGTVRLVPNGSVDSGEVSVNGSAYQGCSFTRPINVTGESVSLSGRVKKNGTYSNVTSATKDVCATELQGDDAITDRLDDLVNSGKAIAAWENQAVTFSDNSVMTVDGLYMDNDFNLWAVLYHGEDQNQAAMDNLVSKLTNDGYSVVVYSSRKLSTLVSDLNGIGPAMMIAPAGFVDDECDEEKTLEPNSVEVYDSGFLMGTKHYNEEGKLEKVEIAHIRKQDGIYTMSIVDGKLNLEKVYQDRPEVF